MDGSQDQQSKMSRKVSFQEPKQVYRKSQKVKEILYPIVSQLQSSEANLYVSNLNLCSNGYLHYKYDISIKIHLHKFSAHIFILPQVKTNMGTLTFTARVKNVYLGK